MACGLRPLLYAPFSSPPRPLPSRSSFPLGPRILPLVPRGPRVSRHLSPPQPRALPDIAAAAAVLRDALADAYLAYPPTWSSAAVTNLSIFVAGAPLLLSGLSASGVAAAYILGTLTWRAFGSRGFLLVVAYFLVGTAVTKLKIRQKEALGVAEKRGGRRGPGSVIGSSAAGCVCALLSIYNVGGGALAGLWRLGFVASFCTKLSDTVSSEIGKAYGRTTYLVTTFKIVPKGTEGAVSVEGTLAGIVAAMFLSGVGYSLGQSDLHKWLWDHMLDQGRDHATCISEVNIPQCVLCVLASQIANFGESIIGATLQDKEGFEWLNNDVVNVINISAGGILAVLMQWLLLPA